jgi:hypothetical protein
LLAFRYSGEVYGLDDLSVVCVTVDMVGGEGLLEAVRLAYRTVMLDERKGNVPGRASGC